MEYDGEKLEDLPCPRSYSCAILRKWTPDADITRFTDPDHPDFWQQTEKE